MFCTQGPKKFYTQGSKKLHSQGWKKFHSQGLKSSKNLGTIDTKNIWVEKKKMNPLVSDVSYKVTHTLKQPVAFKHAWPFSRYQTLKG